MKLKSLLTAGFLIVTTAAFSQEEKTVKAIFNEALTDTTAYHNLRLLCKNHKGRITGTPEANKAVDFVAELMQQMQLDRVEKQSVAVPRWVRGEAEKAFIEVGGVKTEVPVSALGMSIGTGEKGLTAPVIEVQNFKELEELGTKNIAGKIVFFNRPMDPTLINTFAAYGGAGDQRSQGAAQAARFGAVGVVVRSLTTASDNFPHTGVMRYNDTIPKIPAVAISTKGADLLSGMLKSNPETQFSFRTTCYQLPDSTSYNVIGEIKGSDFPEQIITIGGHLDAWDNGEGAHDDGAGCMQSLDVLRIFMELGIKPKRTIRAVAFMDEEVMQTGGKEYARQAELKNENHYFALEADRGAYMPKGFGISAPDGRLEKMLSLQKYFEPYGIDDFVKGGGGVDIGPLAKFGTPLSSFIPEMQRYFDVHHSGYDTFEQVHLREFQLGSAAMASFIYLIDRGDL
ncbi:MAG: M20/M25/M40 family metallo-hydrolase [Draconibacterium sp.]